MPKTIKHDRTHNDDFNELLKAAEQALVLALAEANGKALFPATG